MVKLHNCKVFADNKRTLDLSAKGNKIDFLSIVLAGTLCAYIVISNNYGS